MIRQQLDAGSRIACVCSSERVVHGSDDGMASPQFGRELHKRALPPKCFVRVGGAA